MRGAVIYSYKGSEISQVDFAENAVFLRVYMRNRNRMSWTVKENVSVIESTLSQNIPLNVLTRNSWYAIFDIRTFNFSATYDIMFAENERGTGNEAQVSSCTNDSITSADNWEPEQNMEREYWKVQYGEKQWGMLCAAK